MYAGHSDGHFERLEFTFTFIDISELSQLILWVLTLWTGHSLNYHLYVSSFWVSKSYRHGVIVIEKKTKTEVMVITVVVHSQVIVLVIIIHVYNLNVAVVVIVNLR